MSNKDLKKFNKLCRKKEILDKNICTALKVSNLLVDIKSCKKFTKSNILKVMSDSVSIFIKISTKKQTKLSEKINRFKFSENKNL